MILFFKGNYNSFFRVIRIVFINNYAAYLLADSNGTSIKVAKYAGTDKVDLIENEEYGYCSLIKATKSVLDKLDIENRTLTKITNKERIEKKLVNPIALREAVINAIVHNDYSREVPPVFEIFSDRIQITSYGGLPVGLSEEDFFDCRSMSRNRELMRIFKDIDLVEQLGSGMSRILRSYDKSAFKITEHFLIVTFKFNDNTDLLLNTQDNTQDNAQDNAQDNTQDKLNSLEDNIIKYCLFPRSKKEIADKFGYKNVKSFAINHLQPLIENNIIMMTIPDKPTSRNQKYVTVKK